jgi:hypothetical protein
MLARGKHSNLSRTFVNYGRKNFYIPDTRAQCYKTILSVAYEYFCVCPWRAFRVYSYERSSFVQNFVHYGRKRFYNIDTSSAAIAFDVTMSIGDWDVPVPQIVALGSEPQFDGPVRSG